MKHIRLAYISTLSLMSAACSAGGTGPESPAITQQPSSATTTSAPRSGVANQYSAKVEETSPADLSNIVSTVMKEQYGDHYDSKHACWEYSFKSGDGRAIEYCMRPKSYELVNAPSGKQLYFYATNADDISDDSRYFYSQSDLGLMGAFKLGIDAKDEWHLLSYNKAMDYGSGGSCGCDKARFVRLNNNGDYGWMFDSGGVWQGTVVLNYSIVAAINGNFKDISSIPEIEEDAQGIKYEIQIIDGDPGDRLFPLRVTKLKSGVKDDEFIVKFNEEKNLYVLPGIH